MSTSTERSATLNHVIDYRVQVYGDPVKTFVDIAKVWSGILGVDVNPTDVPLCLIGMKIVRTTQAPDYSDNSDDIEGYLDIFRKLVGPDMIHARSVDEYVTEREARAREEAGPQSPSAETYKSLKSWGHAIPEVFVVDPPAEGSSRPTDAYDVVVDGTGVEVVDNVTHAEAAATAAELNATLAYRHGYCNKCGHALVGHDSLSCDEQKGGA